MTRNKMQNNSKKNRVKSQPDRIAQVSQPRLLGFHAAATALPTIFQFLHRILVRKFVAQFFYCFKSNSKQWFWNDRGAANDKKLCPITLVESKDLYNQIERHISDASYKADFWSPYGTIKKKLQDYQKQWKLAAHIFWKRRSTFPVHSNIEKMVFTWSERKISEKWLLTSRGKKQIWRSTMLSTAISVFSRISARQRHIANNCTIGLDSKCAFSSRSTQSRNINRCRSLHLPAARAPHLLGRPQEIRTTRPSRRQTTPPTQRQVAERRRGDQIPRSWRRASQALAADLPLRHEGRGLRQFADYFHRRENGVVASSPCSASSLTSNERGAAFQRAVAGAPPETRNPVMKKWRPPRQVAKELRTVCGAGRQRRRATIRTWCQPWKFHEGECAVYCIMCIMWWFKKLLASKMHFLARPVFVCHFWQWRRQILQKPFYNIASSISKENKFD